MVLIVCNTVDTGPVVRREKRDQQQDRVFGVVRRWVCLGHGDTDTDTDSGDRKPISGQASATSVQTSVERVRPAAGPDQTVAIVDHRNNDRVGRDQVHTEKAVVVDH